MAEQIVGIGAVLEPSPSGNLQVTRLVPGGPAQMQGGINVGDMLTMVDGVDVRGMDLSKVAPLIRGTVGTSVTLGVMRPGATETTPVMLTRQPTAKITGSNSTPKAADMQMPGGAQGAFALDEAFPKQTLDKLRQLRVTLEQERIAVAKEREQSAKLQATLEEQIEKLEGRCKQLLEALDTIEAQGSSGHLPCGHKYEVAWCTFCRP
mmetsp:Transcript_31814/g.75604  ORF Transcript_31814/g.75604 Transcript_31814/m.75604 type:complete len:207 (-) Transcript_31814:265-885(-)|eukprot:CAMPEP_0180139612 /NCGR_PEP_ID=MMETSP0986-20121125/13657_1 /TAXON_ID=697907 /ORGANISM="non described non described, Strain CCMP2293" /LENGTH=206 /DNA_ID=CAMNT_0022081789 /DNA_START=33 /DNA_END=653 /DNA_ORIENTATION=+